MDKYDYKMRADEIRLLISERRFEEAVVIADEIDWKNVKNGMMLCTISDLYKVCKRYEEARDVLHLAYLRNPSGRMILYSLCELSIKLDDIVMAIEYYKEYLQVAPRDTGRFILQYKLYEAQEVSLEERIAVLEELQKRECREKWMYELAFLYHRMGLGSSCVDECNQIVTFFGEGKYVLKALELKKLHEDLSEADVNLYERLTGTGVQAIKIGDMNVGQYNTIDLQKELADNLKEVMDDDVSNQETYAELIEEPIIGATSVIENSESDFVESSVSEEATKDSSSMEESVTTSSESEEAGVTTQEDNATEDKAGEEAEVSFGIQSLEVAENLTDGQVAFVTGNENLPERTRVFDKEEIEKALGGSEVVTDDSGRLPVNEIDNMLSLEGDGQISLVVDDAPVIEKQITGQICIDEVLYEWERVKKESEQRWTEDMSKKMQEKKDDLLRSIKQATNMEYELEEINIPEEPVNEPAAEVYEEIFIEEDVILLDEEGEVIVEEAEPTAEELSFDRTEFADPEIKEASAEPEAGDITTVLPEGDELDYLIQYAEASKMHDEAMQAAILADGVSAGLGETIEKMPEVVEDITEVMASDASEAASEESVAKESESLEETSENAEESIEETEEVKEVVEAEEEKADASVETTEEITEEVSEDSSVEEVKEAEVTDNAETVEVSKQEEAPSAEPEANEEVPSEPAEFKGDFTDEQFERFESYIYTESGREQVTEALKKITMNPLTGNAIIGSQDKDGSIELAKALIMELSNRESVTGKVAKIKASSLNAKDAKETLSKLKDGALIILDANELRKETLNEINQFLQTDGVRTFVALTMISRHKHKFIMNNADALKAFDIKIDIDPVDDVELVRFAKNYAYELEYSINEMGSLALHTRIDEFQTNSHNVTISEVKELVDQAIKHASKKNAGHFFDIIFGKRYDENDMVVLGEKDFTN